MSKFTSVPVHTPAIKPVAPTHLPSCYLCQVSVRHGPSLLAEALLSLPEVPVRSANDGPAALWVTVGLLATEGMALQLKMKKADVVSVVDEQKGSNNSCPQLY